MMRRLLESAIIEAFETNHLDGKIKTSQGEFVQLTALVTAALSETAWNLSRNAKQALPHLRDIGHMSAHFRRFTAQKGDIERVQPHCRIAWKSSCIWRGLFDPQDSRACHRVLLHLHKLDRDSAPDHGRGPFQTRQRDVVLASSSRSTCVRLVLSIVAMRFFDILLFLHGLGELPGDDLFNRLRLRFFEDPLLFRKSSMLGPMCFLLITSAPSGAGAPMPSPHPALPVSSLMKPSSAQNVRAGPSGIAALHLL